ncbi:MAG: hypothetical protein IPP47_27585 [Bryobacterales bacterium]|nr:hypothetical protein [Bryobacterales bacterium]
MRHQGVHPRPTHVLTEAAINGKMGHLRGLHENVIMRPQILATTGMADFRHVKIAGEIVIEDPLPEADVMAGSFNVHD